MMSPNHPLQRAGAGGLRSDEGTIDNLLEGAKWKRH
jgi:hypothetical protein